ncbi:hypothetical protein AB0D74_49495 [Streptomyces sp. NPDC048278]|uniref:hypothetical protein n=1 Tax=Streptomyces sp. NPDC048278 TaxID=3155809 RepID=UPI003414A442
MKTQEHAVAAGHSVDPARRQEAFEGLTSRITLVNRPVFDPVHRSAGPSGDAATRPDPGPAITGDKPLKQEDHDLRLEY